MQSARLPDANQWPAPPVLPIGPLQPPTHVPPFEPLELLADSPSIQSFAPVVRVSAITHPAAPQTLHQPGDWTPSRRLRSWIWSWAPWRRQSSPM